MGILTLDKVLCSPLQMPAPPPAVVVPFLGQLQEFRKGLYSVPDPSEYLLKLLSSLNVAMLPVRQFIELLETLFLFRDCIMAIPNAVMTLSPQPIFDCMKKLIAKLVKLIYYLPPLSYIRTFVGLAAVILMIMDEIIFMLLWLDQQITVLVNMFSMALRTGDTALMKVAQCRASELQAVGVNAVEVLKLIGPLLRMLLEPIISFIPNAVLQAKMQQMLDFASMLDGIGNTMRDLQLEAIGPLLVPLRELLDALSIAQNTLVDIHNVVAPLVGMPTLGHRDKPKATNF